MFIVNGVCLECTEPAVDEAGNPTHRLSTPRLDAVGVQNFEYECINPAIFYVKQIGRTVDITHKALIESKDVIALIGQAREMLERNVLTTAEANNELIRGVQFITFACDGEDVHVEDGSLGTHMHFSWKGYVVEPRRDLVEA